LYLLLSTFVFFLVGSLSLFTFPSKTFFIFIYFFLNFSPYLYVPHYPQLYFHQYLFLSLCLSIFFSLSILSPLDSISVCDFVCHNLFNSYSFFVFVCLIDFNHFCISISFVYTTFLSPSHVHSPLMFVFSFSFSLSLSISFWFFFIVLVVVIYC